MWYLRVIISIFVGNDVLRVCFVVRVDNVDVLLLRQIFAFYCSFDAIILVSLIFLETWLKQSPTMNRASCWALFSLRIAKTEFYFLKFSNNDSSQKHMLVAIFGDISIYVTVISVLGKVCSSTKHTSFTEIHVKTFFTLINYF